MERGLCGPKSGRNVGLNAGVAPMEFLEGLSMHWAFALGDVVLDLVEQVSAGLDHGQRVGNLEQAPLLG